jgi:hypothetical protein
LNYDPRRVDGRALPEPIDILLADVAIRVQLSKTDYDKACARFETMQDWVDRKGSPLQGLVTLMYPQGSMATGSTVARVSDKDEYDIDAMVVLNILRDSHPDAVLDALYRAIRGESGSRYYDKTIRHTRCVCVSYEDGMHIDLTPAVQVDERMPRTSLIFHSKPEDQKVQSRLLLANPWGLANWFNANTPQDPDFASFYEHRALDYDLSMVVARAPADPGPDQEPAYRKSRALIALQLIKRWRNVLFERRDRANLRRPPSVLLTKLIADYANQTRTLSEEVEHQARCLLTRLEHDKRRGKLISEVNPCCQEDVLTDRWPAGQPDQDLMIDDLSDFVAKLVRLRRGDLSLAEMSTILEDLFGTRPARQAVESYVRSAQPGGNRFVPGSGRILGGAGGSLATSSAARQIPRHDFFGD